MIKDDNTRPESGFAPGSGENTEQKTTDFNERLKKAGDELLGGAKKDRERGRTAALKEVESLKVKLAEAEDQRLRAMAELENFRQRKNREIADQEKYAPMELARAILPIWDNIGRALDAAPDDESVRGFVDGVRMVHRQFLDVLAKNGVVRIDAEGEMFDPNRHESIAVSPSDEPSGTILNDARPGFILHDRIVRPAQVVVATQHSAEEKSEE